MMTEHDVNESPLSQSRRAWKSRALLLGTLVAAVLVVAVPALGATPAADAAAGETTTVPGSVWLLPFQGGGDPITWTIVLASFVAVSLIIMNILRIRRSVILPEESTAQIEEMIGNKQYKELIDFTEEDDSFVSRSLNPALKKAPSFSQMREAMETAVAEETAEEFRRLEYINILANIGPLLGLLGTVVGIMEAFLAMQAAGGAANVSQLAGGISTALGTTMLGLILAIPCLVAYGVLRNKADRLTTEAALQAEEFLLMIKPGGSESSSSSRSSSRSSSAAARSAQASERSSTRAPAPTPPVATS